MLFSSVSVSPGLFSVHLCYFIYIYKIYRFVLKRECAYAEQIVFQLVCSLKIVFEIFLYQDTLIYHTLFSLCLWVGGR